MLNEARGEHECDNDAYDRLRRCAASHTIGLWNAWREEHRDIEIHLSGADLSGTNLTKANLEGAYLERANLEGAYLEKTNLRGAHMAEVRLQGAKMICADVTGADLNDAQISGADLSFAQLSYASMSSAVMTEVHLDCADLRAAELSSAVLRNANLQSATLIEARLENADLRSVCLNKANLRSACLNKANLQGASLANADLGAANLEGADLCGTHLEGAQLQWAHLEGAQLRWAHLEDACLQAAYVDSETDFLSCVPNRNTDCRDVNLDMARMGADIRFLLRYNVRRLSWEAWRRGKGKSDSDKTDGLVLPERLFRRLVTGFMWSSDYGRSPARILKLSCLITLIFALVYSVAAWLELTFFPCGCGQEQYTGILKDLVVKDGGSSFLWLLLRSMYFSVVVMTTLGFGDISADPTSWFGYPVVMLNVLAGYLMLGSLIAVLSHYFVSEHAMASFPDETRTSWVSDVWRRLAKRLNRK